MALIICTECGKKFSDKARQCPECGCPTEFSLPDRNVTSPAQNGFKQPSVRREMIEKIMSQIRMERANPQNEEGKIENFHIDNWTFRYTDADRLFFFLYNTFHEETDALLEKYKENFLLEVKAVSILEIKALEGILNKCEVPGSGVDPSPFASEFLYKIHVYRKEKEDEDISVDGIDYMMEQALERTGKKIFHMIEKDRSIAPSIEPHIRIIMFYFREILEGIEEERYYSLDEYISLFYPPESELRFLNKIQHKYHFWGDCFNGYTEFYANSEKDDVTQARAEIKWRKEYMANPNQYKLWEKLAVDVERIILFLIQSMNEKCGFGINPAYYDWDAYQEAISDIQNLAKVENETDKKEILKESFLKFPFYDGNYTPLLEIYGDKDGQTGKLLKLLGVDVEDRKKMLFQNFVDRKYAKIDWKREESIVEAYEAVQQKEDFLQYSDSLYEKKKKICDEYNDYSQWEELLKEYATGGLDSIKKLCGLFERVLGEKNYAVSVKIRKGLEINNGVEIFFAHDDTLLGSGKNGFAVTNRGIFARGTFGKPSFISYDDLRGGAEKIKCKGANCYIDDKLIVCYTGSAKTTNKICKLVKYIVLMSETFGQPKPEQEYDGFCPKCGAKIPKNGRFCIACGTERK